MSLNIPSYVADPNYRYKMPRVIAKIEGRGNGIKTIIVNMKDVSKSLHRPAEYCTKFCGIERGAQSKYDASEGKAIVNGVHTDSELQQLVDRFIEKYVLCPNCSLPEADMVVNKGHVRGKCNACGHSGDLDNVHKLATYILKNPPGVGDSTMGAKSEGGSRKKERQRDRASRHANSIKSGADEDGDPAVGEGDDDMKNSGEISGSAAGSSRHHHHHHHHHHHKDKKEKRSGKKKDSSDMNDPTAPVAEDGDDTSESVKVSKKDSKSKKEKKAKKETDDATSSSQRRHHKHGRHVDAGAASGENQDKDGEFDDEGVQSKGILSFDSVEITEVIARLVAFLKQNSAAGTASSSLTGDFFQEVRLLQVAQDFSPVLRVYVGLSSLYQTECDVNDAGTSTELNTGGTRSEQETSPKRADTDSATVQPALTVTFLKEKMPFLSAICDRSVTGDMILEAFEAFVALQSPATLGNYAHICSVLYHADLVDEDVLLERYSEAELSGGKKSNTNGRDLGWEECKKAARSFIQWLDAAESASSSEEDD